MEENEIERKENEEEYNTKKRTKEERSKKKDDKRPADHLRILSHISSTDDKLDVMCKKYSQAADENRRLSLALKHSEKKVELLLREREQLQIERNKGIMARKRLENLCRELQKQNKLVKNESLQRVKEQEEIRKDLSEKFQGGLAQITTLMNQNIEKNAKMYEENLEINKKFKEVYEQVEQKEQQLLKVHQQMKVDLQIADAKLAKVKMEATAEKEALLKEKQQLLLKMTEYQAQIKELQATEIGLRSEISMYTDKYDEFQNALNRSNKIYDGFNVEMEKMANKIYTLEKETTLWKQRWANSHDALVAMATDKQARDAEMATLSKKLTLLQDLCRMFQCERTKLLAQLKTQNNKSLSPEPSTVSAESQEIVKYMEEMDEMPNLKNTFDQLQVPLTDVSEMKQETSDTTPKTATTKVANGTAISNETSEISEVESDKENVKRLQTDIEDTNGDSSEDLNSSKEEETAIIVHIDSTADNVIKMQKAEDNNQESFNTTLLTTSGDISNVSDKPMELSNSEEINDNSQKELTEAPKIENISEEINEVTESLKDVKTNDKSGIEEHDHNKDIDDDETEIKTQSKGSEQSAELSGLKSEDPEILGIHPADHIILQEIDLIHEKEIDLLRNNTGNHVSEKLESQAVESKDDKSRMYENGTDEVAEKNEDIKIAHITSNTIRNGILSEDLMQDDPVTVMERNNEVLAESSNNYESVTQSTIVSTKNITEVSKTSDLSTTTDATSLIENEFKDIVETANVIKNNSELVENTVDIHLTEDLLSTSSDIPKQAAEAACPPVTNNIASSKEVSAKSEGDCTEGKFRKLTPKNGKRRKK